jgi:magnesium transporter
MEATRKLISKSGEVFASPVTYLASYVIPTEKRTAGELQTLNEILKLGGGGSGEKTKGDTTLNESNAVLGLPSALLWSGNVLHGNTASGPGNNSNSSHEKGNITQTLDRMWTVLDQHGRAKNLKASKTHVAAAFGIPLRDLHYLDPLRPTLTPANIFIRPRCLIVNLEHMKFIVTAETALFLNAESLEVKRFIKFLRKYLKEVENAQLQKREDLVKSAEANMMENIIHENDSHENDGATKLQQSASALKNATTTIKEERVLHLPFELLVLECAMHELGVILDNETIALEREAAPCMEKMLQSVQAEELAEGRRIKEKLNALILRLEAFTEALSSILEHDESLDAMCLSKLKVMELVRGDDAAAAAAPDDDNDESARMGAAATTTTTTKKTPAKAASSKKAQFITRVISNPTEMTMNEEQEYDPENEEEFETIDSTDEEDGHEHEGAEALLEAYFMHSAATQKRAHMLKDLLQNTEAVSSMILDRQRNELIKIDLVVSAALFACSIISVAGSIFGMNLQSNLETKSGFFVGVIIVTSALAAASFLFIIFYCSRKNLFKL